jgi:predicted transcriptional regulator
MTTSAPFFICQPASKGRYVRLERTRLGLTQSQLADRCGVNQSYISKIELNKYVPYYIVDAVEVALVAISTSSRGGA